MLDDKKIPAAIRHQLRDEYEHIQRLIDKLEHDQVHLVAFGKVSTGKSSLLNALLGRTAFSTSPLHGETTAANRQAWSEYQDQSVVVIDTPGTDELDGESREAVATETAAHADIILFVLDGDLSRSELQQLERICVPGKPIIVVLNKADLYTTDELEVLLDAIRYKTAHLIKRNQVIAAAADPNPQTVITVDADGNESIRKNTPSADISKLKQTIWQLLEEDGKSLTALNASMFASQVSDDIARKITEIRKTAAQKIIRTYCIGKGIGVACNPVPIADLVVAAGMDVAMIRKLSSLYGLTLGRSEASKLTATIMAQLALLMGAVWSVNLLSSVLKTVSGGLSTTVTAAAQGSLAYYATYLVGQIAEKYFIQGKSWGDQGPKKVAKEILDSLDRNSILMEARAEILNGLKKT